MEEQQAKVPGVPVSRRSMTLSLIVLVGLGALVLFLWLRWPGQNAPAKPPDDVKPSPRGWMIRYNATISLAVKGSDKVRLDLLPEMLDEKQQLRNFYERQKNGKMALDQEGAYQTIATTLKAVVTWHKKLDVAKVYGPDNKDLRKVYEAIRRLAAEGSNVAVRKEALRAEEELHLK